jgi:hypothetical protein
MIHRSIGYMTILFLLLLVSCHGARELELKDKGNVVIRRIEQFRETHGYLPDNLTAMGMVEEEAGPIYYLKQDSSSYIVWFGLELGESMTWDSKSGKWK